MRFEWDGKKNRGNLHKHKIGFDVAQYVFHDPNAHSVLERVVEDEERWQTMGMVEGVIIVVAHTFREENEELVVRIISARKATPMERKVYVNKEPA